MKDTDILRRSLALLAAPFVALTFASGCAPISSSAPRTSSAQTEILWDTYGVPHIYAADRQALAYAFGWAQMLNHSDLILRLFAQGRGLGAELLGKNYLDDDRWAWTVGIPAIAARDYSLQTPETRAHVDAFVAGINAFAVAHPEMIGDSVRAVLPVTGTDVFADLARLTYAVFLTSRGKVDEETRSWERGSNAWAVAPSR